MRAGKATEPALDALLPSTDSDLQATVFVESLASAANKESQDRLVTEPGTIAEHNALGDLDLLVWGNSIYTGSSLTEVGNGRRILNAVGEFYDLAANGGLSIAPFFSVSTVSGVQPRDVQSDRPAVPSRRRLRGMRAIVRFPPSPRRHRLHAGGSRFVSVMRPDGCHGASRR